MLVCRTYALLSTGTSARAARFSLSAHPLMARVWQQRPVSDARLHTTAALMDAAEKLLFEVGYAGVTTRAVAEWEAEVAENLAARRNG